MCGFYFRFFVWLKRHTGGGGGGLWVHNTVSRHFLIVVRSLSVQKTPSSWWEDVCFSGLKLCPGTSEECHVWSPYSFWGQKGHALVSCFFFLQTSKTMLFVVDYLTHTQFCVAETLLHFWNDQLVLCVTNENSFFCKTKYFVVCRWKFRYDAFTNKICSKYNLFILLRFIFDKNRFFRFPGFQEVEWPFFCPETRFSYECDMRPEKNCLHSSFSFTFGNF